MRATNLEEKINRFKDIIVEGYKPEKIILFGSAATPESWDEKNSDLDFAIIKDTNTRFINRGAEVRSLFWGMNKGVDLDVLVYTPDEFEIKKRTNLLAQEIAQKGKVIYER